LMTDYRQWKKRSQDTRHTEQPSPSCQPSMTVKTVVDTSLQEAAEDRRNRDSRLKDAVTLAQLAYQNLSVSSISVMVTQGRTFVIPRAEHIVQRWPVSCFEQSDHETKSQ
jgi:hypothetical protein